MVTELKVGKEGFQIDIQWIVAFVIIALLLFVGWLRIFGIIKL